MVAVLRLNFGIDYSRDYGYGALVKTVSKGKLKAKMLEYFREVERTAEPLIVTDHGRKVLEVRPFGKAATTAEAISKVRTQLFGDLARLSTSEVELLAPEWKEADESDDSWWLQPGKPLA